MTRATRRALLAAVLWPSSIAAAVVLIWLVADPLRDERDCPRCGPGPHVVPWEYGYPVWLKTGDPPPPRTGQSGGCGVTEDSPKWHCDKCGRDWGRFLDR